MPAVGPVRGARHAPGKVRAPRPSFHGKPGSFFVRPVLLFEYRSLFDRNGRRGAWQCCGERTSCSASPSAGGFRRCKDLFAKRQSLTTTTRKKMAAALGENQREEVMLGLEKALQEEGLPEQTRRCVESALVLIRGSSPQEMIWARRFLSEKAEEETRKRGEEGGAAPDA